jgi:hypothetical protein
MLNKIFYWAPRVLSILFAIFLSIFALDVFGEYHGLELALALFIHLLPSFVLAAVIFISWKHDLFGAVAFLFVAGLYIYVAGLGRPWTWYAFISGPAALTGILFFINWLRTKNNLTI